MFHVVTRLPAVAGAPFPPRMPNTDRPARKGDGSTHRKESADMLQSILFRRRHRKIARQRLREIAKVNRVIERDPSFERTVIVFFVFVAIIILLASIV